MTVKIMKFGGSSFRRADCYRSVSAHIANRLAKDADQLVIVVSAMYGVTESLKTLALSVNERCGNAALDTVLTTGEIVSVGLLEAALERYSVPVSSLCGYSLGITTCLGFNRASINNIDTTPLLRALQASRVVIIAGAQAVDKDGRISMLGRNSSDLTAVIAADVVGSGSCEIYSDVCGVYTSDPKLITGARLVREISYTTVSRMARCGARVLHYGAVEYASNRNVMISCKSLVPQETVGTLVGSEGDAPTVVIAPYAKMVKFSSYFEQQVALTLLDKLDITCVGMDQDGGQEIYLSYDVDFALSKFAQNGITPLDIAQMVLVTEINKGFQRTYKFQDLEAAVSCAQRIHATLYPEEEH